MENNINYLTTKELSIYLPYGLQVQISESPLKGEIHALSGIAYDGLAYLGEGGRYGFIQRSFRTFKPILYPISCLTKTIQHEGREFIPIVELCKIQTSLNLIDCTFEFGEDDLPLLPDIWVNAINEHGRVIACLIFNADNVCFRDGMDNPQSFNQYQLFQKLAEWHIDFLGLIEKGLAIDKNTLK